MNIYVIGLEKLKIKCEADKIKAVDYATQGLIDAGRTANGIAADFAFQRPTGALAARYTLSVEEPLKIALYNVVGYWKYPEYGTGIYSTLGSGRSTPWSYYTEVGPWRGWHRTSGQKPKMMLNDAVKNNKALLGQIVRNRVLKGLIYGA
jgi:hypothetical protein